MKTDMDVTCGMCYKHFDEENSFVNHFLAEHTATTEDPNDDIIAEKKSQEKRKSLKSHESTLNKFPLAELYLCEVCGRQMASPKSLANHVLTHVGAMPYYCKLCYFSCISKLRLQHHMLKHEIEPGTPWKTVMACGRLHECETCNSCFRSLIELTTHYMYHLKAMPFSCKCCNLMFQDKKDYTIHSHLHVVTMMCLLCNDVFSRRVELLRHVLKHNESKYFRKVSVLLSDKQVVTFSPSESLNSGAKASDVTLVSAPIITHGHSYQLHDSNSCKKAEESLFIDDEEHLALEVREDVGHLCEVTLEEDSCGFDSFTTNFAQNPKINSQSTKTPFLKVSADTTCFYPSKLKNVESISEVKKCEYSTNKTTENCDNKIVKTNLQRPKFKNISTNAVNTFNPSMCKSNFESLLQNEVCSYKIEKKVTNQPQQVNLKDLPQQVNLKNLSIVLYKLPSHVRGMRSYRKYCRLQRKRKFKKIKQMSLAQRISKMPFQNKVVADSFVASISPLCNKIPAFPVNENCDKTYNNVSNCCSNKERSNSVIHAAQSIGYFCEISTNSEKPECRNKFKKVIKKKSSSSVLSKRMENINTTVTKEPSSSGATISANVKCEESDSRYSVRVPRVSRFSGNYFSSQSADPGQLYPRTPPRSSRFSGRYFNNQSLDKSEDSHNTSITERCSVMSSSSMNQNKKLRNDTHISKDECDIKHTDKQTSLVQLYSCVPTSTKAERIKYNSRRIAQSHEDMLSSKMLAYNKEIINLHSPRELAAAVAKLPDKVCNKPSYRRFCSKQNINKIRASGVRITRMSNHLEGAEVVLDSTGQSCNKIQLVAENQNKDDISPEISSQKCSVDSLQHSSFKCATKKKQKVTPERSCRKGIVYYGNSIKRSKIHSLKNSVSNGRFFSNRKVDVKNLTGSSSGESLLHLSQIISDVASGNAGNPNFVKPKFVKNVCCRKYSALLRSHQSSKETYVHNKRNTFWPHQYSKNAPVPNEKFDINVGLPYASVPRRIFNIKKTLEHFKLRNESYLSKCKQLVVKLCRLPDCIYQKYLKGKPIMLSNISPIVDNVQSLHSECTLTSRRVAIEHNYCYTLLSNVEFEHNYVQLVKTRKGFLTSFSPQ